MNRYNLTLRYRHGLVINSGSRQCKITETSLKTGVYGYQGRNGMMTPWEDFKFDKPELLLKEIKDSEGKVTHLTIRIEKFNGYEPCSFLLGDNFIVWPQEELKSDVKNCVGLERKVDLSLVKNPLLGLPQKPEFASVHVL